MTIRSDELRLEGLDGLAKAIILQACNDYLRLRGGRRPEDGKAPRNDLADVLRFFRGRWYALLNETPAEVILARLDEIARGDHDR